MQPFEYITDSQDNFKLILKDNGTGYISKGMVVLELISSAKQLNNDFMIKCLDIPSSVNISKVLEPLDNISDEEKVEFISEIIKCEKVLEKLKFTNMQKHDLLRSLMINMFDKIHTGSFSRKKYKYFLPYIKRTINSLKGE